MRSAAVDFDDDADDEFAIEPELGMLVLVSDTDGCDATDAARADAIAGRAAVARSAIRRLHLTHVPAS